MKSSGAHGVTDEERGGALQPEISLGLTIHQTLPGAVRFDDGGDGFGSVGGRFRCENVLGLSICGLVIDQPIDNTYCANKIENMGRIEQK